MKPHSMQEENPLYYINPAKARYVPLKKKISKKSRRTVPLLLQV